MLRGLIAMVLSGEARRFAGRARSAALLYLLAFLAFAIGAGFLVGACFVLAAERFGTVNAAVAFGLGFGAAGLASLIVNALMARAWRRRREREKASEWQALAMTAALALLPSLVRSRAGKAGLILPVLGLIALRILDENRKPDKDDGNPEA
jgi:hypothetical protein